MSKQKKCTLINTHTLTLKKYSENTVFVFCNRQNFFLRATVKLVGLHNFNILFKRLFFASFTFWRVAHTVELFSHCEGMKLVCFRRIDFWWFLLFLTEFDLF